MTTPIISLRIAGTKQRQAGFAPLVTVGVLPGGEGDNMDRVTLVAEKPAYIIKHTADYILYQLIDRQVKSFDADAPGVLSIALTIPSHMQLANNVSPYTLLKKIYETFRSMYMERLNDGRDSFINTSNDSERFRTMLGQYSLEERKSSYVQMNPTQLTGIVCVPQADLEEFFRNTQYKEFAKFKDIEVGVNCHNQVSMGLSGLQIPLPPAVFEIWVNGKSVGHTMKFPKDSYMASAEGTKEYTFESVDFTLGELMNAPLHKITKNGAEISLDFERNRISCNLKKVDIYYTFVYEWKDDEGAKDKILSLIQRKELKFWLGTEDISQSILEGGTIKACDIKGRKVAIKSQPQGDYSLDVSSRIDDNSRQIITKIVVKKKMLVAPTTDRRPKGPGTTKVNNHLKSNDYPQEYPPTPIQEEPEKKWLDLRSFILGIIVGLLVGIGAGIWGTYSMFTDKEVETPSTEELGDTMSVDEGSEDKITLEDTMAVVEESVTTTNPSGTDAGDNSQPTETGNNAIAEDEKLKQEKVAREAEEKARTRKQILDFVNKKDLSSIRQSKWRTVFTEKEMGAIEAVLDMTKYKGQQRKKVEKLLEGKTFKSIDEVVQIQRQIWAIGDVNENPTTN